MTHLVGNQVRTEFILDPAQALRRGARLERMARTLPSPRPHGVMRAPHHVFNALDDQRQLDRPRLVNGRSSPPTWIRALNIEGLLKTKTDFREMDRIDRAALMRLKSLL